MAQWCVRVFSLVALMCLLGGTAQDARAVNAEVLPAPVAVLHVSPTVQVGAPFSIDGSQSHGINYRGEAGDTFGVAEYTWDFGDGSAVMSGEFASVVEHRYRKPGRYHITLTVTDAKGRRSETSVGVTAGQLPIVDVAGRDATAITTAIQTLKGRPGIVQLEAGSYAIDRTVEIPSNITLRGAGADATRLLVNLPNQYALRTARPAANNVRITGLSIAGSNADKTSEFGMLISNSRNFHISSSRVTGFRSGLYAKQASGLVAGNIIDDNYLAGSGYGILLSEGAYLLIRDNRFGGNRHSVAANGLAGSLPANTGYDIIDNEFVADTEASVDAHPGAAGRLRVTRNIFRDAPYGLLFQNGWGYVRDNSFQSVTKYAVRFGPRSNNGVAVGDSGARDFAVEGNTFVNSPHRIWYLDARENVSVDCVKLDELLAPNIASRRPMSVMIDVSWQPCPSASQRTSQLPLPLAMNRNSESDLQPVAFDRSGDQSAGGPQLR